MPFVRLDPAWVRSPKVNRLTRLQRLAWIELLSWCVENRTNGAGSAPDLRRIWSELRSETRTATMRVLQEVGLVVPDPDRGPDAWLVHDFLVYQTSKEEDEERRLANRQRQKRYREKHGQPSGAQNRKRRAVTRDRPGAVTPLPPGGSNAPLTSPPSLKGGEEGESNQAESASADRGPADPAVGEGRPEPFPVATLVAELTRKLKEDTDA